MVSAYAFYLAAFAPEEMKTGSGAGRALFFGRMDAAFAAPHRHKGLSAAIPQIAFDAPRRHQHFRVGGSTDEGRA